MWCWWTSPSAGYRPAGLSTSSQSERERSGSAAAENRGPYPTRHGPCQYRPEYGFRKRGSLKADDSLGAPRRIHPQAGGKLVEMRHQLRSKLLRHVLLEQPAKRPAGLTAIATAIPASVPTSRAHAGSANGLETWSATDPGVSWLRHECAVTARQDGDPQSAHGLNHALGGFAQAGQ